MLKSTILASLIGLALAPTAYAQQATGATCDDTGYGFIEQSVNNTTDPAMKEAAMKEFMAAKAARDNKQLDSCAMHLGNIIRMMNIDMTNMPKG